MPDSDFAHRCDHRRALDCVNRRQFVLAGAGTATLLLGQVFPGRVRAADAELEVEVSRFPKQLVCPLGELEVGQPREFDYPEGHPHTRAIAVKLGRPAGGGIGREQDVVAFNMICTHMGGELDYNADHRLAGPCGEHLTSFDLTRHGIVVAGQATSPLPQVILELDDEAIVATGLVGLVYGYHANPS